MQTLPSLQSPTHGRTHVKAHASASNIVGQIVALIHGGFTLQVTGGCASTGKLHIYTPSSATMSGPTPAPNLYARVTPGSGTCTTSITASAVTISTTALAPSPSPSSLASPSPAPSSLPTPGPTGSPIPLQTNKTTVLSTIAGVTSGGFTLNPGNGLSGYMHVYTTSGTILNSGTPKTGLYAQATGTGPLNNFTGTYVTFSTVATSSVTVSGTAIAASSYGFTLNAGAGSPAIPIVMNAQTMVGGSPLTTGSTVKVTGVGTTASSIVAQQIVVSAPPVPATPTPGPISQKHVLTGDYLGSPYGTTAISWSQAAPYLTWAQVSWKNATAISSAGIKTQYYVDPNTTADDGDAFYTSDESTFAHDCSGHRISGTYGSHVIYQMDIGATSMQNLFNANVSYEKTLGHFDAVWEDNAGPVNGFTTMPCNYTDSLWLTYGQQLNQASPLPVIFNGLEMLNGYSPSLSLALLQSNNTIGGNYEHCYSDSTTPKANGQVWQATENTELQVAAQGKLFECMLRNLNSASSSTDARIYALASFLMTYNPSTSVLWEEFATNSGFKVEPESQLVLLSPTSPAPSSVTALQQTGGAYGRQYSQCFYAGRFLGPCAVVVNSDPASPHPFPFPQYTHTLVLSGGGILDGGTVATNGPAPPVSLPAEEAAIAFP